METLEDRTNVTEYFMASRVGANLTYLVLKQLVQHRWAEPFIADLPKAEVYKMTKWVNRRS